MNWIYIRIMLTAMLLYLVYHETGVWTVVAVALCTIGIELNAANLNKVLTGSWTGRRRNREEQRQARMSATLTGMHGRKR